VAAASGSPPLVLIVDDEPDHVDMYQLALELAGFRVVAAYTGMQGVELARALRPHATVLDLRLPDISGWDVLVRLKSDERTREIPVVLLTAAATSTLPEEAARAGCAACLTKPCFPDRLAVAVRSVLPPHLRSPEV
jgi:CheY-like chemotaxis protein